MSSAAMTKYERLGSQLKRVREQLKKGGKLGTQAALGCAGGIAGGFLQAKYPVIPNTTLKSAAVGGLGLLAGAMADLFGDHNDNMASAGIGLLAYALGVEAEQHFSG